MKYPKKIQCPECLKIRFIDYRELWAIKKRFRTSKCYKCSRPKKGETNSGSFKKGCIFSDEFKMKMSVGGKGKKKPPRTKEHLLNLGRALKGKSHPQTEETRKKLSELQRGERAYWWKDGRDGLKQQIRECYKYKIWRGSVFKRDNYTCQKCGVKGGKLDPHHVKSFSKILDEYNIKNINEALNCEELWNTNNGETICRGCHRKTDSYGGRARNRE